MASFKNLAHHMEVFYCIFPNTERRKFMFVGSIAEQFDTPPDRTLSDRWYLILNLESRVIHISNEFEDYTGYSLSDYKVLIENPHRICNVPS